MTEPETLILSLPSPREWTTEVFTTSCYVMASRPSIMARVRDAGGLGVLSVSAITVAELYLGVAILPKGHRKATLLASLDRVLTRAST